MCNLERLWLEHSGSGQERHAFNDLLTDQLPPSAAKTGEVIASISAVASRHTY